MLCIYAMSGPETTIWSSVVLCLAPGSKLKENSLFSGIIHGGTIQLNTVSLDPKAPLKSDTDHAYLIQYTGMSLGMLAYCLRVLIIASCNTCLRTMIILVGISYSNV